MFKDLFSNKKAQTPNADGPDPQRVAVAALLVEAARADEQYEEGEIEIIDKSLAAMFGVSLADAAALRVEGEKAQAQALDIQRFTREAKQLDAEEKIAFIEKLWEVVLSDGVKDMFEDTLIRRICGLIYVDDKDSGAARARVEARLAAD